MSRNLTWLLLSTTFMAQLIAPAGGAEKNIVLFVTDDQSPDAGCYGNPVIQTPNMDVLAADGTLFAHAFCTTASCSASRSVILTGLHNHANGHYGHQHHQQPPRRNTNRLMQPPISEKRFHASLKQTTLRAKLTTFAPKIVFFTALH